MHCPRCGQQQISAETKFCSRCGFQLALVSELLANGGFLPQLAELYKDNDSYFTRKNGVIFTILWFIFFVMMMPAFFGIADIEELAAASAVFGVFSTIMLFVVSLAFLKKPSSRPMHLMGAEMNARPANLPGGVSVGELPPQQTQPAASYIPPDGGWRVPDTGDLQRPGSVIENTTKLLKKDEPL
ncbi:MAG TPA: zinc ribbon domain-containing protein [Pyrinomonadaceae bacterium]|nr:zinc ribbon domain-containing protein [Pyrinomonadaceae bacterium]